MHIGQSINQEGQLCASVEPLLIFTRQFSAARVQITPDNQQWLFDAGLEGLHEFEDMFSFAASLVPTKQTFGTSQSGECRHVLWEYQ